MTYEWVLITYSNIFITSFMEKISSGKTFEYFSTVLLIEDG